MRCCLLWIMAAPALCGAQDTQKELESIAQELLSAIAPGDTKVWDRHLAPECLFTDHFRRAMRAKSGSRTRA